MKQQSLSRSSRVDATIDMTPLIDVVFQLLIFLMVSSQFTKPDKQVELPSGHSSTETVAVSSKKHLVTITPENELIFNGDELTVDMFEDALQKTLADSQVKRLEVRGDTQSNLGTFIQVVETAKASGIESLSYHKKVSSE